MKINHRVNFELSELEKIGIVALQKPSGCWDLVEWHCNTCNIDFTEYLDTYRRNKIMCPQCRKKEHFKKIQEKNQEKILKSGYLLIGEYQGSDKNYFFKCLSCGVIFLSRWVYLNYGLVCPECKDKRKQRKIRSLQYNDKK